MKTYYIFTLGCQMNYADSEKLAMILEKYGLKSAPEKGADLIIVNACSVRQSAVDRIWGKLKVWKGKKIMLTGCVLPKDRKKMIEKVDKIIPSLDFKKLASYLEKITKKKAQKLPTTHYQPLTYGEALIPIMTGCDHFCSYCAVPYARGREKSRSEKEILCEIRKSIKRGAKKIILLGQNVNRYNQQLAINNQQKRQPFVELLKKIVKIPGGFKITFMSPNPWDFPKELIEMITTEPKLAKEIHLPVQSGDNKILKKMNRPYTAEEYLKLVKKLRNSVSNLCLSTDIIVGFPGESKKAFQNTVDLCKKAKFNKAYVSQYSPRPGTIASKYQDDIPKKEKKRRWLILEKLINKKN